MKNLDPELSKSKPLTSFDVDRTLDDMFAESHSFMTILSIPEFRYIKSNAQHLKLIRKSNIIGKSIIEVEPELESQGIIELLNSVAQSGKPYIGNEVAIHYAAIGNEPPKTAYLDFVYQPLKRPDGTVYAISAQGFDVTERVLSRKALELAKKAIENERENFRNLFCQTPEMVCILEGPEHRFGFVNQAHINALGFNATGQTVRKAQPESIEVHGILDDVYASGLTAELREIPVTLGTQLRYFNLTYSARRSETGDVNGIMILGSEVTDIVHSRKILQREAKLVDAMPSPFYVLDKNWDVVSWNPACVELIGVKSADILNKNFWQAFPDLKNSAYGENFRRVLKEQKIFHFESFYNADKKWFRTSAFPFEDGIAVMHVDMTDIKNLESELEKSKLRYQLLFDNSPLPKWIIDTETMRFTEVNNAAINHYGYTKEEFLSMKATDVRPPEEVKDFLETMKLDFTPDNIERINWRRKHRKKDGTIIEVEVSALDIILDGRKQRIGAIVDVTDRVKSDSRQSEILLHLQLAKEEADRANELKSAFLANMSHEIRTPLGAMLGFADLLKDPEISSLERSSYLEILTRNGEQLSYLINDILDLSKVEAGHLTLEYSDVSPAGVCEDVISLLKFKAKEKDLALELEIDPSTPDNVVTDETRLRQIIINLVGNAIKFTPSGSVTLKAYGYKQPDGIQMVSFEIIDTGIGISVERQKELFQRFVQADGSMTRRFGGTGLGLALSRRLARALGGDATIIQSEANKGTTFKAEVQDFPERKSDRQFGNKKFENENEALPVDLLKGIKVLVVDDSLDNQMMLSHFMTKFGASVDTAENGLVGFRKALTGGHALVLMDIQMPEMDGYSATQKLRTAGYDKPIIALTAHAMSEVRKKCLNVGYTDYLAKPVNAKDLIRTVASYSSNNPTLF